MGEGDWVEGGGVEVGRELRSIVVGFSGWSWVGWGGNFVFFKLCIYSNYIAGRRELELTSLPKTRFFFHGMVWCTYAR